MEPKIKIGITGATGVLGRIICAKLAKELVTFSAFKGDIRNTEKVKEWLMSDTFDAIIHFAALVPTYTVDKEPIKAVDVNMNGTLNLFKALKDTPYKPWFFYASTSHVYKSSIDPIKETDSIEPINFYGVTKLMGEKIVDSCAREAGIEYCIGRIFSMWHSTQAKEFLYPSIQKRLAEEDLSAPFKLRGGNNIRDLSNAEEIVDKVLLLYNRKSTGIYNIGSGNGITIKDFIQSFSSVKLNFEIDMTEPVNVLVADIAKFNNIVYGNK